LSVVHSHVQRGDEQAALRVIEELMAFTDEPSVKVGAALLLGRARIDLPGSEKLLAEGLEGLAATADGLSIESDVASVEQLVYWISQGWFTHGWLAFMNNELDAALEYLQSSLWLKPEAYVAETIAQIHELRRDLEPAKRYFALALALPGRASSARGSLAQLLGSEGMVDAAIEAARRSFADSQQLEIGTDLMATFLAEDSDLLIKISAQGKILAARSLSEDGEVQRIAAGGVGREFALAIPGRDLESLLVRGVLRCAPGATASDQQDRQGDEVGYDCSIRLIAPRTP
jgi:tetratricopeptide (TPR) repeat protein